MGTYDAGWDAIREARQGRAAALGLIPPDVEMVGMPTTGDWQALDADQRRYEAKRMAVYAGMVEAMDHHIGRLVPISKVRRSSTTRFLFSPQTMAPRHQGR